MSYDEHLISMAGGDGEPDLDAIEARAAAGFGPVREAGASAWDQGAHAALKSEGYSVTYNASVLKKNPYRAVTVRGGE